MQYFIIFRDKGEKFSVNKNEKLATQW